MIRRQTAVTASNSAVAEFLITPNPQASYVRVETVAESYARRSNACAEAAMQYALDGNETVSAICAELADELACLGRLSDAVATLLPHPFASASTWVSY